jgi:hypothetical protein
LRSTSFTDIERLARQQIDERIAGTHQVPPSNDRSMSRRNRVRAGTAETLRRLANALDVTN